VTSSGYVTAEGMLADARSQLMRLRPREAAAAVTAGEAILIDIRPVEQRIRDGEVPGATAICRNVLEWRMDPASPHRDPSVSQLDRRIILICNEGYQSSLAASALQRFGLNATDVIGGVHGWCEAGLPTQRAEAS
jgi:rhodanese-related sulfurtransferase